MLGLERTIPDGRPDGWTKKLGIEPATAQLELGLGLSLLISRLTRPSIFCYGMIVSLAQPSFSPNPNHY